MDTITSKPLNEESILAAFNEREKKLAALRVAGKTSPAVWIFFVGAWFAAVWVFYTREIQFSEFLVVTLLLSALASYFRDYSTRLKILSDHLIAETQTQPLVGSSVNSVNSVQKS